MSVKGKTKEKVRTRLKEPKHYRVIMHNDDFTTMEFVVEILIDIFHKNQSEAERLMMRVHQSGMAAVGVYPFDIAMTKIYEATERAKQEDFPFRLTAEEA